MNVCGCLYEKVEKFNMALDKQNYLLLIAAVVLCTHGRTIMLLDNVVVLNVHCKPLKFVFLALACMNCMPTSLNAKGLVSSSLPWRLLT